ncbi:MAG: LamG domain-containing protein [Bacteriovoracaceae bacterium]|nr:LamG domain-containing protein [Bacteriovoracaceae bacterium]
MIPLITPHFTSLGGAGSIQVTSTVTVSTSTWYHIVGTYDGAGNAYIYVNGVSNTASGTAGTITWTSAQLGVGSNTSGSGNYFGGYMDELAIYGTELSAGQVLNHYSNR